MNIDLHDISELFVLPDRNYSSPKIYWLSQRGEDAYPLYLIFPFSGIICANWSSALSKWTQNYEIYSLEKMDHQRYFFSSLKLPFLLSKWHYNTPPKKRSNPIKIVPYMSIQTLEKNHEVLGPDINLVKSINNKAIQRRFFQKWSFRTPKYLIINDHLQIDDASKFFQKTEQFIIAPSLGSLGTGVKRCSLSEVFAMQKSQLLDNSGQHLVSEFIDGVSVNTSIVITKEGVMLGWPSVQILGESLCNAPSEFFFCGSNFTATHHLDKCLLSELADQAIMLGKNYARLGYFGFLGADWILDNEGQWWLIEVNPRLQGSTLALNLFEIQAGYPSILSYWNMEIPRNKTEKLTCNKFDTPCFYSPVFGFQLNIYACKKAILEDYQLPSNHLKGNEKWYISGIPLKKTVVEQSAEVFKIIAPQSSLSLYKNQLLQNEKVKMSKILDSMKIRWG